jgi:hypothetical protein
LHRAISSADTAYAMLVDDSGATVSDDTNGVLSLAGPGGSSAPNGALNINAGTFLLDGGALKAGSISIGTQGIFLISPGQYTLTESITDNGALIVAKTSNVIMAGFRLVKDTNMRPPGHVAQDVHSGPS